MSATNRRPRIALGLVGAAVGGCVGYFAFDWIARQGFYALILPPGLLGLAAGYAAGGRSQPFAVACGVAGLALGLLTEWQFFPFIKDKSFVFFITHVRELKPLTLIMLAIGPVISYRLALGMDRPPTGT